MNDLNKNEKFYYFPDTFPIDSQKPGNIIVGDIMLYENNCLVLFYESFTSSYSYTRIGYIEDAESFAQAIGDGNVNIIFELLF